MIRETLKNVEPRFLSLVMGLMVALVATSLSLYGIKPQYMDFSKNRASLALLENQMDDPEQLQQSIDNQRLQIQQLQHQLHGESGNMPINQMESYLIGRLQNLSWQTGVKLISVRPGAAIRVLDFDEISFEVSVRGEYKKLYAWLNSLSDNLGFVMVANYKIQSASQNASITNLNMDVTLIFYRAML
jgi:Tfp pilus assembly protein PilO